MELFAAGEHPATHAAVDRTVTCGGCRHLTPERGRYRCGLTRKTWVRLGWPGCARFAQPPPVPSAVGLGGGASGGAGVS